MKDIYKIEWARQLKLYSATISMSAKQVFDGSLLYVIAEYFVRFLKFIVLIFVWKSLAAEGVDLDGMTIEQLLTYTLMSSVLYQQLNIVTPATSALWEGSIIGRYTRPMPVMGSLISETIGRWWIPVLLFYSLPIWLLSPLFGITNLPLDSRAGLLAFISLALSASLGFALDFLFAAFAMRLKNGCWIATRIREAIAALLSGALIPFALLPYGIGRIFAFLPFGSIASAPLSIYTGISDRPLELLGIQIFWNLILWVLAVVIFRKSEEGMISYGG